MGSLVRAMVFACPISTRGSPPDIKDSPKPRPAATGTDIYFEARRNFNVAIDHTTHQKFGFGKVYIQPRLSIHNPQIVGFVFTHLIIW